jgi:transposase
MSNLKYALGIDMAKNEFKACLSVIDIQQKVTVKASSSFANTPSGFQAFLQWVTKHGKEALPVLYLMEATGIYYEPLAWFFYQQGQAVTVILPNKAKKYLQSLGLKSKNDTIDAQGLSCLAAQQQHRLWQPLSQQIYLLRSLTRLHESLPQQRTALHNQLQAAEWSMSELKQVRQGLSNTLNAIDNQHIKKLLEQAVLLKAKYEKISGIKGVGLLTFAVLVAETNGFELFEKQGQLVSYAGYDVVENHGAGQQSGQNENLQERQYPPLSHPLYACPVCPHS